MTPRGPKSYPSAVQTFLIADVRGYTRFSQDHGDEAAARLTVRFAQLADEAVTAWQGQVVETRGDEVLAVFSSVRGALRAAVALQAKLSEARAADPSLHMHAGIGIDAGEAVRVEDGYRGGALNLAARLCSIASPGEIFASEGVIHLARKTEGLAFVDRGQVSLKGLKAPVRVIQIAPEGQLPIDLPPLQSVLVAHPNNLPDEPTPFIGREREIAAVADLLEQPAVRLVTLTGTGGTGKTRLALQVAAGLLNAFRDGVFFVSLAPLTDPALVPSTIADVLGVQEKGGVDLLTTLIDFLRGKRFLLILDNYEHLVDASSVVSSLLDACRELCVLVTSRIPLHLLREHEYPVPPLALPDAGRRLDPAGLSAYDAVALFIERAQAITPDFEVTDENAEAVVEICRRLDGLPLAIELAAKRIRLFAAQALLQRLSDRLTLLVDRTRDRPARHQTLRAAIDWSYSLLTEEERTLFARLSVFAGGCTIEAAESVCDPERELDLLEGIGSLVEQGLLRQGGKEDPRFSMLETLREYAVDHLQKRGELELLRARHAGFYLQLAETADSRWIATQERTWLDRLDMEWGNLDAAVRWLLASDEIERAARLTVAQHGYRYTRGHWTENALWLETLLRHDGRVSGTVRGRLLRYAGVMATLRGEYNRAEPLLRRSLEILEREGDTAGVAAALNQLAILAAYQDRFDDAADLLNRSLTLARASGDERAVAEYLDNLGGVMMYRGDYERAASFMEESLDLYRRLGHGASIAEVLRDLAWVALLQEEYDRSIVLLRESLQIARDLHDLWTLIYCLEGLARSGAALGQAERSFTLWGAVESLKQSEHMDFPPSEKALHDRYLAIARRQTHDDAASQADEAGRSMSLDRAVEFALQTDYVSLEQRTFTRA